MLLMYFMNFTEMDDCILLNTWVLFNILISLVKFTTLDGNTVSFHNIFGFCCFRQLLLCKRLSKTHKQLPVFSCINSPSFIHVFIEIFFCSQCFFSGFFGEKEIAVNFTEDTSACLYLLISFIPYERLISKPKPHLHPHKCYNRVTMQNWSHAALKYYNRAFLSKKVNERDRRTKKWTSVM